MIQSSPPSLYLQHLKWIRIWSNLRLIQGGIPQFKWCLVQKHSSVNAISEIRSITMHCHARCHSHQHCSLQLFNFCNVTTMQWQHPAMTGCWLDYWWLTVGPFRGASLHQPRPARPRHRQVQRGQGDQVQSEQQVWRAEENIWIHSWKIFGPYQENISTPC